MRPVYALAVACAFAACSKPAAEPARGTEEATPTAPDTVIAMESRSFGYFEPSSYRVVIHGDGTVAYSDVYVGPDEEGMLPLKVRGKVPRDTVRALVQAFVDAGYFEIPSPPLGFLAEPGKTKCPISVIHSGYVHTSIQVGARRKQVRNDHSCLGWDGRERVLALEQAIDRIAGTGI